MSEQSTRWRSTDGPHGREIAAPGGKRGPDLPVPGPAENSWEAGDPAVLDEHRGSFHDAEQIASYRWAAPLASGRATLDIGCEAGHGTALLAAAGASRAVGTETDPSICELASRAHGSEAGFTVAEPVALPFAPGSFELITCFGPLETTGDPEAVIAGIRRVLKPGGMLAASLPLSPPRDPIDGAPLTATHDIAEWARILGEHFGSLRFERRRACFGSIAGAPEASGSAIADAAAGEPEWLGADEADDSALLVLAGDGELPELEPAVVLVGSRDLAAYRETLAAWEQRARRAEADGSAKHWELVASREAQRRLRKRLHDLEHKPLRKLFRVLRGKPAQLSEGPPIRPPEQEPEAWD